MKISVIVAVAAGLFLSTAAHAKCDRDPNVNCLEELNGAARRLKNSGSFEDAIDNAKATGNAVKSCVNCALDNIESNVDKITGGMTSNSGNDGQ